MSDDDIEAGYFLARSSDPDTSHEAAAALNPLHTQRQHLEILHLLCVHHDGLIDQEIVDLMPFDVVDSGVRTRRHELTDHKLVRDTGKTRPTRSGRRSIVWNITYAGYKYLEAHAEPVA